MPPPHVPSIYDDQPEQSEPPAVPTQLSLPSPLDVPTLPTAPELPPDQFIMPGGYLPPRMMVRSRKPRDIVPGVCFESSVGMLVAPPYVGKTLLLMDLAIALATGEPWLKWRPTRAVPTIVYALDSPGWESREQAECLMAGRGIVPGAQPFFLVTREEAERMRPCDASGEHIPGAPALGPLDILDDRWMSHLVTVAQGAGARLIGLDSFSKIHTRDENDRREMEAVMKRIARLAMETRAHVLALHHTPVVDRGESVYAGRGSSVIAASVDFKATVVKVSPKVCRFVVLKGRGSDEEGDFYVEKTRVPNTGIERAVRWECVDKPAPVRKKAERKDAAWAFVVEALADSKVLSRQQLMALAVQQGVDSAVVDSYLARFRNAGLVQSPARGHYSLTPRGAATK